MKKINLKGISEILSERELKNVVGGGSTDYCKNKNACPCPSTQVCVDYGANGGKCCI